LVQAEHVIIALEKIQLRQQKESALQSAALHYGTAFALSFQKNFADDICA